MNCPDEAYIDRFMLGGLSDQQASEFQSHLGSCPACTLKVSQAHEDESLLSELRVVHTRYLARTSGEPAQTLFVKSLDRAQELVGTAYQVVKKAGQGAAGEVFQAVDTVLDRPAAVKFLNCRPVEDDAVQQRWHEARLLGQLNHPNIAQVYQIGEKEGVRFIVMEWIDGKPLTEAWREKTLGQRLSLFVQVLDAVSAAHKRGIIHRDIKPSNILVGADSRVKVLDFGIAVDLQGENDLERYTYRGTPAFSAPEQITVPVRLSPATDVFALGVLLYHLLANTLPFGQTDVKELFYAIRTEHPELPSALQDQVPIALQNICLKSLEKNPHRRYRDAQELSDEIHRYLRGEKVWSRPSFLTDKIQQEVFYHRQKLKVWRDNELITEREYDKLEHIYQRVIEPPDPSIIEARTLSLSQVCLYLGGWISVLGSIVLFYKTWEQISVYWRPAPAIAATVLMILFGIAMLRKKETRLAVGFFATANLLIPITILLTFGQWDILSASHYPWGTETIFEGLRSVESYLIVGNLQAYLAGICWLFCSFVFLRLTRSSIFVLFSILAFTVWLSVCYVIGGMETWEPDIIAGRYLYAGIGLFSLGAVLDRRRYTHYACPLSIAGMILIVGPLTFIALSDSTLFGWLLVKPESLTQEEQIAISFVCNGMIYLGLATLCRRLGTILQRRLAQALNWLGPLHILTPLRILDLDEVSVAEGHQLVYRIVLPIASLGFVFASVTRQMKSFFFAGLGGVAAAVHKFTIEYLDKYFAWPISLITVGITCMFVSWLVPGYKALKALQKK